MSLAVSLAALQLECRKTVDVNSLGGVARMVFVQHAGTPGHSGP